MDIDSPYALLPFHVEQFERDGFIKLKNVLAPDVLAFYGRRIEDLTLSLNTQRKPLEQRSTYDKAFLQVMNLWEQCEIVKRFVLGRKLARIATELLRVDGVRLYHDQSLYKEAGGGATPIHADQYYWPLATDRCVTAWIPLQEVTEEMGPLGFYARSHTVSAGRGYGISDEGEAAIRGHLCEKFDYMHGAYQLGEVSFHLGWTFHGATSNRSLCARSAMTVIYMDAEMRLAKELTDAQENDRDLWCPGTTPGELISTNKNPLMYTKTQ